MLPTLLLALTMCAPAARVEGQGPRTEETRALYAATAAPTAIVARGSIQVVVVADAEGTGVLVQAEENLRPLVVTTVVDGTLQISARGDLVSSSGIVVTVRLPRLKSLKASGTTQVKAPLQADASIDVSGAARVVVSGAPKTMAITARGAAFVDADAVSTGTCTIVMSGAAEVLVGPTTRLEVKGSGVGRVTYGGNPQLDTQVSPTVKVSRVRS